MEILRQKGKANECIQIIAEYNVDAQFEENR